MTRIVAALSLAAATAAAQTPHLAPTGAASRVTVADSAEPGTRLLVEGRVLGTVGRPIAGASIYVYHTDANGVYVPGGAGAAGNDRPRLHGYLRSDAQGRYGFSTIVPASYPNSRIPAHIHFEVSAPGYAARVYEIVFADDPFLTSQFRGQAADPFGPVAIVTAQTAGAGRRVTHDIGLRP